MGHCDGPNQGQQVGHWGDQGPTPGVQLGIAGPCGWLGGNRVPGRMSGVRLDKIIQPGHWQRGGAQGG